MEGAISASLSQPCSSCVFTLWLGVLPQSSPIHMLGVVLRAVDTLSFVLVVAAVMARRARALVAHGVQEQRGPRWDAKAGVWVGDRAAAGVGFTPPDPLWIFGYGSLCWRPAFAHTETFVGHVHGWGRFFAQRSTDHRGTPASPGLVATLLTDEQLVAIGAKTARSPASVTCGVCYLVPASKAEEVLAALDFREKGGYTRELIDVYPRGESTAVKALLYSATPENPGFCVEMIGDPATASAIIGRAHGPSGPNREYLLKMAQWLEQVEERDDHIEALVRLMPEP